MVVYEILGLYDWQILNKRVKREKQRGGVLLTKTKLRIDDKETRFVAIVVSYQRTQPSR
jgi:hypothetical protein